MSGSSACRSCEATVLWRRHVISGNLAPIQPEAVENGNVIVIDDRWFRIATADDPPGPRHVVHHVVCPQGPLWRRKKKKS